tara:strand:- start:3029 stop:3619 length:591 start_codon:yes stop_codon:yes gene_type:complete
MLLDSVKMDNDSIEVINDGGDIFEHNVYQTMEQFFLQKLTHDEIIHLCLRDTPLFSSLIHEHMSKIRATKHHIRNLVSIYDTLTFCDIFDRHIYTRSDKNVVRDMVNMYRFQKINMMLEPLYSQYSKFDFTQQFTKLSSEMNIKKKISRINTAIDFHENNFDILQYVSKDTKFVSETDSDKAVGELVTKFKKEFKI